MLLTSYFKGILILGLPGCVMHDSYTSFDVFYPESLLVKKLQLKTLRLSAMVDFINVSEKQPM